MSYSSADRIKAKILALYLESQLILWWDQDLISGVKYSPELFLKIDRASVVLVAHSKNSAASSWVERECKAALAKNKLVIPILLDDTPLPAHLAPLDGIDLRGWNDASFHPQIAQLIRDIKLHLATQTPASTRNFIGSLPSKVPNSKGGSALLGLILLAVTIFAIVSGPRGTSQRESIASSYQLTGDDLLSELEGVFFPASKLNEWNGIISKARMKNRER